VKTIRDKAEAVAAYARQAKDTQLIEHATEIKVRAERRAGEMLHASSKNGERATRGLNVARYDIDKPTLEKLGITRDQSSRWQQVASIPDKHLKSPAEAGLVVTGRTLDPALILRAVGAGVDEDEPLPHA
jgi:hypothetical protein